MLAVSLKGPGRSNEPYVTKSYKIFGFQWKQFQVLFKFFGRDIFKIVRISQKGSQLLDSFLK